jgi:DNA mismatch endonuclease, patch repair protein
VDVLSPAQRKLNMSRIRGKDTKPELSLRRYLHAAGFRYRIHHTTLPGKPDIVFPRYHVVAFVHGCFWHGHDCPNFKLPLTRPEFWQAKIEANKARDQRTRLELLCSGWRVLIVWECALKGRSRIDPTLLVRLCSQFLTDDSPAAELLGDWSPTRSD